MLGRTPTLQEAWWGWEGTWLCLHPVASLEVKLYLARCGRPPLSWTESSSNPLKFSFLLAPNLVADVHRR